MMRTSIQTWTSILAAAAAVALAGSAVAQPHRDERRDERHDDRRDRDHHEPGAPPAVAAPGAAAVAPPAGGVAVAPPADPKLAERLHQLEEQHQRDRKLAVNDQKAWQAGRAERASQRRNEIAGTWGNSVSSADAQAELKTHAERMARLNRILDIANQKGDTALASRCQTDIQSEIDRDARAMQAIRAKEGVR